MYASAMTDEMTEEQLAKLTDEMTEEQPGKEQKFTRGYKIAILLGVATVAFVAGMISNAKPIEGIKVIQFSSQCDFKGYVPGVVYNSQKSKAIKPAEFEASVLQHALGYFNTGSGAAATLSVIDAVGDAMQAAPQLTAAIGILSVGAGLSQKEPSPQDILDKASESVKLLSDEVNVLMDQLKDYVDANDLQLEKNIMDNNYRDLYSRWTGCAKEATVADVNDCQRLAVSALHSAINDFQRYPEKFTKVKRDYRGREKLEYNPNFDYRASAGTWQWMGKECGSRMQCMSHDEVKRLEIGIIPFRDYATLHLLALKTLEASYRKHLETSKAACTEYKETVDELANRADEYVRYVKWAKEWTYIRQYEENDFYGVRGRSGGRPARAFAGGFLGTIKCQGGSCKAQCTQMLADNTCSATGSHAEKELSDKCQEYVRDVKEQLNEFWHVNVLKTAEIWKEYAKDAEKMKQSANYAAC